MMHSYTAYGLGVSSEFVLPELWPGQGARDIVMRRGSVRLPDDVYHHSQTLAHVHPESALLYWPQVGAFQVSDGSHITVDPNPNVPEEGVRLLLLGSVLGVLLHQRGQLLLHGSAVEIDGGVAVFLGHSGWGKSTTAAAFHRAGYRIVADDISAVDTTTASLTVVPGYPQLKLNEDSAQAMGHDPTQLASLHHRVGKRGLRCPEGFATAPLPLRRLYVLAEGPSPLIEPLTANESLIELVRHSYAAGILKSTGCEAEHMLRCARLAADIGVRRLRKGESLADLPRLIEVIADDVAVGLPTM